VPFLPGQKRQTERVTDPVESVVLDMQSRLDGLTVEQGYLREFLGTYQRTTLAVGKAVDDGYFEDPAWVERWDVAFAELYLDALDAFLADGTPSRPGVSPSTLRPICPLSAVCCSGSTPT
jgi:hypothetical protein